jgi:hypothetical protein
MHHRRSLALFMLGATFVFVPSALAHGRPASQPTKGPRCARNGVTTNPAGHANCGRRNGQPPATSGTGDQPPATGATGDQTGDGTGGAVTTTGDQSTTNDDQGDSPGGDA